MQEEFLRNIFLGGIFVGSFIDDIFIYFNDFYMFHWQAVRHIEGAAQRVQEDTMRFAKIMEGLGVSFMRSVMTLFAFLPLLWGLSEQITEVPWIGEIDHSLVYIAIVYALGGTST